MELPLQAAAISGIAAFAGAGVGALVATFIAKRNHREQRINFVYMLTLKMHELSITYPYLDDEAFCQSYPMLQSSDDHKSRYESYCCIAFNALDHAYHIANGKQAKINVIINPEELIRKHHRRWKADRDNIQYDEPFRHYVDSIIDNLRKRGEITP